MTVRCLPTKKPLPRPDQACDLPSRHCWRQTGRAGFSINITSKIREGDKYKHNKQGNSYSLRVWGVLTIIKPKAKPLFFKS